MLKTPFFKVAKKYGFKEEVMPEVISYLHNREVTRPLKPSDDYHYIKSPDWPEIYCNGRFSKTAAI
jgi:putative hydrolase of the HAD superfamily